MKKTKNAEFNYYKDLAKWYVSESKNKILDLPLWVKIILTLLVVSLLAVSGVLFMQMNKPEPVDPTPTVTVDTTPAAVPDLVQLDRIAAEGKLSQMGFTSVQVETVKEYASSDGDYIVIKQEPAAGVIIRKSEPVKLYYGSKALYEKGKKSVTMPAVTGLTVENATKQLKDVGFVKITAPLPKDVVKERAIVVAQKPVKDTTLTLNDEVTLTLAPGLQWNEVEAKLAKNFTAYGLFSKLEPLEGEDMQFTLAKKDDGLTTEEALSERARTYKLAVEQVLGRSVGKVILVNPGVEAKGDSSSASRRLTNDGLSVKTARVACDGAASPRGLVLAWNDQVFKEEINGENIVLSVLARPEVDAGTKESVVTCTVSGPDSAPVVDEFLVQ